MINYSVLLTEVNTGVFPTMQSVDIPALKLPQDVVLFFILI